MAEIRKIAGWGTLLAAACILLLKVSAQAETSPPAPDKRYRVTGVAAGDTLNVREQAGSDNSSLGQIAPDTDGIMVSGVWQKAGKDIWWELIASPTNPIGGWVNSRFLTVAAAKVASNSEHGYPLICRGSEPFWSVDIAGTKAVFSLAGEPQKNWTASDWIAPQGSTYWKFVVPLNAEGGRGYAAVSKDETCSDEADRKFPYSILLIDPAGDVFTGCCSRR
jgi:uncharacterized membrane protein